MSPDMKSIPSKAENIYFCERSKIPERVVLSLDMPDGKYWCIGCVFEDGDDVGKGNAVMSLVLESDQASKRLAYQVGDDENVVKAIKAGFIERDGYSVTEKTIAIFRLFEEAGDGSWRQLVFEPSLETAGLVFEEDFIPPGTLPS